MDDVCIFWTSNLHQKAITSDLFQFDLGDNGVKPYIIKDIWYPSLSWLMISHK